MPNITTTTAAVFLPTLWSVETLRAAENALVAAGLVKRYDALVKARGQAIKIPNISNLSANAKSANTDVTTQAITESTVTLNIDKWYESSFEVEDMVAVQSNYDLRSEYSEKAGLNIGPFTSNRNRKLGEFGGTLLKKSIPSRAPYGEGVTTMYPISTVDKDIVCSAW